MGGLASHPPFATKDTPKMAANSKSPEYLRGYVDCWSGNAAASLKPDYQSGWFAARDAKRILDAMNFSTDNSTHPELQSVAR
jgi:hypothetical protein